MLDKYESLQTYITAAMREKTAKGNAETTVEPGSKPDSQQTQSADPHPFDEKITSEMDPEDLTARKMAEIEKMMRPQRSNA